ncbi:acyl-CoA dehydrogenase [Oricola indica]|uniref:acyl-CoA dehydrogenase n=1 Tax=Oricola indica TaxID=2872591 RepID=UPI003CCBEA9E
MSLAAEIDAGDGLPVLFEPDDTLDMFEDMVGRALGDLGQADWSAVSAVLKELGLFEALLPASRGGYGGARLASLVCDRLGEAGLATPFAVSWAAIGRFLNTIEGSGPRLDEIAAGLNEGSALATLAMHETDALPASRDFETRLRHVGERWEIDICKRMIPFAAQADWLFVPATTESGATALVVLGRDAFSDALRPYDLIDGTPAADLDMTALALSDESILLFGKEADAALREMRNMLCAALCAEAVGAMRAMVTATREYLGMRRQFGQVLSDFQALRHRFIDMEIALTKAETMAALASAAVDNGAGGADEALVDKCRYIVIRSAWAVSQEAMQMHGAIGMASETPLGAYFKRLLALSLWFGDEDEALLAQTR